jgi:hypothetical protein
LATASYLEAMRWVKQVFASYLLFALLMIPAGIVMVGHAVSVSRDPRITCGEHVMKPGDICTSLDSDPEGPSKQTYEQMKLSRTLEKYSFTILGVLSIVGSLAMLILGRRLRRWLERISHPAADPS